MSDQLRPTVLVIDDEVQIRRLLRVSLESNGYRVIEASTGQEGIIEAAQRKPDVVILDLGLPDLDGVAVLQRLREWSQVPVLVLSVRDREEDKIAGLKHARAAITGAGDDATALATAAMVMGHLGWDHRAAIDTIKSALLILPPRRSIITPVTSII